MDLLLIAGCACFVAGLLFPAYRSHGFFSFGGPGWKVFAVTMVLMTVGAATLVKESGEKALLCFVPGLLNLAAVALLIVGLAATHGPAVQIVGCIALVGWCATFLFLLLKSRGDLRIGSFFWFIACALLSLHAILA